MQENESLKSCSNNFLGPKTIPQFNLRGETMNQLKYEYQSKYGNFLSKNKKNIQGIKDYENYYENNLLVIDNIMTRARNIIQKDNIKKLNQRIK